jgi:hypothetical protein
VNRTEQLRIDNPELYRALVNGRLWQLCPVCGRSDAAGWFCGSKEGHPTGPADWFPNKELSERLKARGPLPENRLTPRSRPKGRPRRESATAQLAVGFGGATPSETVEQ